MEVAQVLYALSFYLFAGVTLFAALMVVLSRQPVHAVLFLILAFFSSAGLIILQGAEFLAMILIIVYVGAVAVLFLFVVMMLDTSQFKPANIRRYWFFGLAVGFVLLAELLVYFLGRGLELTPSGTLLVVENNIQALGAVLYDDYFVLFQLAGLILLVAMIGAIVLTLRKRESVKRQDIAAQVARKREDAVELKSPRSGEGI